MCRDAHSAGLKTELGEGEREEKGYDSMRNRPIFRKGEGRSWKKKLRIRKMDEKLEKSNTRGLVLREIHVNSTL